MMSSRSPSISRLPPEVLDEVLKVRTGKWTVTVVLHLRGVTRRFTELQRDVGGISQKALSGTLRMLERDGFVTRTSFPTIPPRVDYALTPLGEKILQVFEALERFAAGNWHLVEESRRRFDASSPVTSVTSLQPR
jgi:DNA-binding HxlR family transcriptional regulator